MENMNFENSDYKIKRTYEMIGKVVFYFSCFMIYGDFFRYFPELFKLFLEQESPQSWIERFGYGVYSSVVWSLINVLTIKFVIKDEDFLEFFKWIFFILGIIFLFIYLFTFHFTTSFIEESIYRIIYFNSHWVHFILCWLTLSILHFLKKFN